MDSPAVHAVLKVVRAVTGVREIEITPLHPLYNLPRQ